MLKNLAIVLALIVSGILIYAAGQPDTFQVQRTLTIRAPAERIFPYLNDFHLYTQWSPYERKDASMQRSFGGPASGKGASYSFKGNREVGQGRLQITESRPPDAVSMTLDFEQPFAAHNVVEFTLIPNGDGTDVSWALHGPNPYLAKVVQLFFDMDRMVGQDFDAGLANLKSLVEGSMPADVPAEAPTS